MYFVFLELVKRAEKVLAVLLAHYYKQSHGSFMRKWVSDPIKERTSVFPLYPK